MQPRIKLKINGKVVMQVLCDPGITDGDLATMLEDVEQDLRWNVMRTTETHYIKPDGASEDGGFGTSVIAN